jgi:hypothetical protein
MYWEGVSANWEQLQAAVLGGSDVGILVEPSQLVVLDCDVKRYDQGTGWVVQDGTATWQDGVVKRGVEDLAREVEKLGHSMGELYTYTVETKSGGRHLYFKRPVSVPWLTTLHHREDWRVDVIASGRNWVAAPPTPGYRVVVDAPCVELPPWLAEWLTGLHSHLRPLGGTQRQTVEQRAASQLLSWRGSQLLGVNPTSLAELQQAWVTSQLDLVALANQYGGWNSTIYQVTLNLLDVGFEPDRVEEVVLRVASPVDEIERKKAYDTIRSAERKHGRGQGLVGGW